MRLPRTTKVAKARVGARLGSIHGLDVLLVPEDAGMEVQGRQVFDLIARETGGTNAARLNVWRFDFFRSAELIQALSQRAREADVIIVAPRAPNNLPANVQTWLEHWPVLRKPDTGALIALFDTNIGSGAEASNAALLLWRAASRCGMDFFCRPARPADGRSNAPKPLLAGAIDLFAAPHPVCATNPSCDWDE